MKHVKARSTSASLYANCACRLMKRRPLHGLPNLLSLNSASFMHKSLDQYYTPQRQLTWAAWKPQMLKDSKTLQRSSMCAPFLLQLLKACWSQTSSRKPIPKQFREGSSSAIVQSQSLLLPRSFLSSIAIPPPQVSSWRLPSRIVQSRFQFPGYVPVSSGSSLRVPCTRCHLAGSSLPLQFDFLPLQLRRWWRAHLRELLRCGALRYMNEAQPSRHYKWSPKRKGNRRRQNRFGRWFPEIDGEEA